MSLLRSLLACLIMSATFLPAAPLRAETPPVLLVLGDSLSAGYGLDAGTGWVTLLQKKLAAEGYPHRVVNASVSGDTTSGGLARLPAALDRHRPQIVLIELGGNDGLRALPLKQMRANLEKLVDLSQNAKARVLLFEMRIPANYGPAYTDGFTRTFTEVAQSRKVELVPFFLMPLIGKPGTFQDDGIHPSAMAQAQMLNAAWPTLEPLLRQP